MMTFYISIVFCVATRFLVGVGGDARGVLGTAEYRRHRDDWVPCYSEGCENEAPLISLSGAEHKSTISTRCVPSAGRVRRGATWDGGSSEASGRRIPYYNEGCETEVSLTYLSVPNI